MIGVKNSAVVQLARSPEKGEFQFGVGCKRRRGLSRPQE
jgi:hypothetical protein